jgi:hypothetical protein
MQSLNKVYQGNSPRWRQSQNQARDLEGRTHKSHRPSLLHRGSHHFRQSGSSGVNNRMVLTIGVLTWRRLARARPTLVRPGLSWL